MTTIFSQPYFNNHSLLVKYSLQLFLLLFSLFILSACTPEPVEGDKHPSVPKFPAHTNDKIIIEKLFEEQITSHGRTKNYIYTDHPEGLQIYDLNFDPIHLIKKPKDGYVISHMTNNEAVYSQVFDKTITATNQIKNVFEYKAPLFKKEEILYTNIDKKIPRILRSEIIKKHLSRIQEAEKTLDYNKSDFMWTLIDEEQELRTKKLNKAIEKLTKNLVCRKKIGSFSYVLQYPDFSTVIEMVSFTDHPMIKKIGNCGSDYNILSKFPESFDKTVMGNSTSGNHFVFGYTSFGYNYITLKLGNETTKTKVTNSGGGNGLNIIFQSEDKIILKSVYDFYIVTKSTKN